MYRRIIVILSLLMLRISEVSYSAYRDVDGVSCFVGVASSASVS